MHENPIISPTVCLSPRIDVIDDDFIKELKYSTNCSSIFIANEGDKLRICITASSEQANMNDAMRQLRDSVLECVEDQDRDRLYNALDSLNTESTSNKKPRTLLQVVAPTEPMSVHSAETPPTSPKENVSVEPQKAVVEPQKAEFDPSRRIIHVPSWVGNLVTIKGTSIYEN